MHDAPTQSERRRALVALAIPCVAALYLLALLLSAWAARLSYGADLEWMEGGMLVHAWRVQQGLPLYVAPSPEWVPYLYPPGYSWALAGLGRVLGLDYGTGRLLSLLGVGLAAGSGAAIVARHGGGGWAWRWPIAALSAVVFLGTWRWSGSFFDLVRPDGLALGLLGLSLLLGLERGRRAVVLSGLVLALAFVVKQHSALWGLPVLLAIARRDGWRSAGAYAASAMGPALLFVGLMQWRTDGVFLQYVVQVPASHPSFWYRAVPGVAWELGAALPVASLAVGGLLWMRWRGETARPWPLVALAVVALGAALLGETVFGELAETVSSALGLRPAKLHGLSTAGELTSIAGVVALLLGALAGLALLRDRRWDRVFGLGVALTTVLVVALMRAHQGGYTNVAMPLHWVMSVGLGLLLARHGSASGALRGLTAAVLSAQLAWAIAATPWERARPDPAGEAEATRLVEALHLCPEPVLSPIAPWLAVRAGRAPSFHQIALWDVNHKRGPWPAAAQAITEAAQGARWSCVIDGNKPFGYGVGKHYEEDPFVLPSAKALRPRTGWPNRPYTLLRPVED